MELIFSVFNGFKLGLSLVNEKPIWCTNEKDESFLWLFNGFEVSIACFEIHIGRFGDTIILEEMQ